MTWRHVHTSAIAGASVTVHVSDDAHESLYKAELRDCAPDYATNPLEARQRLATKARTARAGAATLKELS